MKIEIVKGHDEVVSRQIPKKDGTKMDVFSQNAYMHQGHAFPTMFSISIEHPNQAYQAGEYTLCPTSYKVNAYGNLELDKYNVKLLRVSAMQSVKAS